ncbi:MAG: hypothetical protein JST19_03120 [Bacteroidetes bacterium]|nr:hypothetical protein [Bacteroidota bacterium]
METKPDVVEIPGFVQKKIAKRINFTSDAITIDKPLSFDPPTLIYAKDIIAFRYGVQWIRGYKFILGRRYVVQIMGRDNQIYSIKLTSVYKIRSDIYYDAWSDIINGLWRHYFYDKYVAFLKLMKEKQDFELGGVNFHPYGISWPDGSLSWDEIALSNYKTYFMIHHRENLKKNFSRNFSNDWNAAILQSLLKEVVKEYDKMLRPSF